MDQKTSLRIGGIRTSSGTVYKIQTRQGIACLFLEREESREADAANTSDLIKKQLN